MIRKLGIAVAFGVVLLLLLELGFSLAGWRVRPVSRFEDMARERVGNGSVLRYHHERFYSLAPDNRWSDEHAGRYATGAWPFRGRPPFPAQDAVLRVVVLGDSTAQGVGVNTSETLAQRLQDELTTRGWDPCALQVVNMGVGGYTTPQVRLAVREALARLQPDAIVLSCGGWNDQTASLGIDDVELLRPIAPGTLGRLFPGLGRWWGHATSKQLELPSEHTLAEIQEAWERGEPFYGTKVPEGEVGPQVEAMVASCRRADVPVVYLVPAHRKDTLLDHPRAARDRDACRAAAEAAGALVIDAPAILRASGQSEERLFLDFAHPSPDNTALLARPVAEALAGVLPPPPASDAELRITSVVPEVASMLGDVRLRVTLAGWEPGDDEPVVVVGGAPLLDVRVDGEAPVVEGLLMANGPGAHDVVVQTAGGCACEPDAVRLERPALEARPAEGDERELTLRVHGRPGDRAQVYVSDVARDEPAWWPAGAVWLAGTTLPPVEAAAPMGAEGWCDVSLRLPASFAGLDLYAQARVSPDGRWDETGVASELLRVPARF